MNIKKYTLILMLFLSSCTTSKYNKLYNQKPAFYSYIQGNLNNNKITEKYNEDVYVTPASCQKIVTALIALKELGSEYRYSTELLVNKKVRKIHNIIIKFSGDPTLTSEKLTDLLRPLKNTRINGSIILDASIFKTSPYSSNLMIDDVGTDYSMQCLQLM